MHPQWLIEARNMASLVESDNVIDDNCNDRKTLASCESPSTLSAVKKQEALVPNGQATVITCHVEDRTSTSLTKQCYRSEGSGETESAQSSSKCAGAISCPTSRFATTVPCNRSPSPAHDAVEFLHNDMIASSPVSGNSVLVDNKTRRSSSVSDSTSVSVLDSENDVSSVATSLGHNVCDRVEVPIIGYEILEERSRFTVFKICVKQSIDNHHWFLFRRFADFHRLNVQLRGLFPRFRLALPPRRWFRDNFDCEFLEDRQRCLQAFINNIISHPDISTSEPVQRFFCFDDPPGPFDTIEESRALCELLEQQLYESKLELNERDAQVALLREEMALQKAELTSLRKTLRVERMSTSRRRSSPSHGDLPLHENKTISYGQHHNVHVPPTSLLKDAACGGREEDV